MMGVARQLEVRRGATRGALVALAAAAGGCLGGCSTVALRPAGSGAMEPAGRAAIGAGGMGGSERAGPGGEGGRGGALFLSDAVRRGVDEVDLPGLPEHVRRDGELAVATPSPLLATAQWPEPARADLSDRRYLYLPERASSQLFFVPGAGGFDDGYRGYRGERRIWWRGAWRRVD